MRRSTVEKGALHGLGSGFDGFSARRLTDLPQQRHDGFNARVQGFPAFDLGHRVKRHPAGLGQFFHLGPRTGVQVGQQGVKNVMHGR